MSFRHLPEGAKARFGKGIIYQIQFSPDSAIKMNRVNLV